MPLKVKKVKNLQSDTWHKDLEIEVENIGTKPIYSILVYLEFPEYKLRDNRDHGIVLEYGERKYIDIRAIGDPQDPHLNPGDTYIFTIEEKYRGGLKIHHEKAPEDYKRLDLHFGVISFGDGTGFHVQRFLDYRTKTSPSVANKHHHGGRREFQKRMFVLLHNIIAQ